MEAGSSSAAPTDLQSSLSREQLEELRHEIEMLSHEVAALGMDRKEVCLVHFCGMGVINFVEDKLLKEGQGADASCNQASEGVLCPNVDFRSSVNEDGTNELRYLFVSNGCAICLLDLKQASSDISHTPSLPKIATLNLIEKGFPVSAGLFKLQSEVYMIGGEDSPAFVKQAYSDNSIKHNPSSCDLYRHLCSKLYRLKGASCNTYRLSSVDNGTISPSECHIPKLNCPKICPVVEEIYGALHVFDSDVILNEYFIDDSTFSHEVLEREGNRFSWRQISKSGARSGGPANRFIQSHLVIGHHIYVLAKQKALVFDSRKGEWEERAPIYPFKACSYEMGTVWDIMMYAKARCVLQVGPGEAEDDKELYVVVALVNVYGGEDEWRTTTEAVAYLVNSVGDVVLKQVLEEFFEGPMKPTITATARVIKADEEGKTMCSIVKAGGLVNDSEYSSHEYLFVNTFTVKELLSCAITASRRRNPFGQFVRVEVKNRYIFKIDEEDDEFHDFVDLQACFI